MFCVFRNIDPPPLPRPASAFRRTHSLGGEGVQYSTVYVSTLWSGVTSTQGTLYEGVVMGVLLSFDEAAILFGAFNIALS
jgi:hypothetical protein